MKFTLNQLKQKNTTRSSVRIVAAIMALMAMLFLSGTLSWADEKSVSEKILDILREKGDISEEQYEELKKQAEAEQAEQEEQGEWKAYWKDGLRVESKDGKFKTRWGGRVQLDWASIEADGDMEDALIDAGENGPLEGNGVEFRRLRLYSRGILYETIGFRLEIDFADFDVDVKDAYLDFLKVPYVGNNVLRIGHTREPISLEELTSSNNITFMERALPVLAFAPSRNTGILLWNNLLDKRLLWQAGLYYNTDDNGVSFNNFSNTDLTARIAGTPWYRDDKHLLHLGLGYSRKFRNEDRDDNDAKLRFRARPESHITDVRLANTDRYNADGADLLNPELALVYGPFSLQGEYFWVNNDASAVDDPTFTGWYAYGSWMITGESRSYSQSGGFFGGVKPNNNFHMGQPGWGAFELGFRYSRLDLTDSDIKGGEQDDVTVGLNWYLNPAVRIMLNYVYADLDDRDNVPDGNTSILQSRFQVAF
ncbi:MAG: porin [Desulfobacterales bacterium]|jgi:phosphate-selective porin OprO/OprP